MNAEVEQRIVEMRFDNEQFEKGAKQTLSTLEKLDGILDMLGSGGMDHLTSALETMEYRFSRLGIAGAAAIQNITGKVMNLASNLLTAIPEQIISGGTQRALNIENAKFQLKGLGIAWEEVADDIDHAVMGTAYGVDEAAKAAAILGASNVQYKNIAGEVSDMGRVLRSISGIAAMTNSSYDDIANVMGDIFAMGKVTAGELQRFELRGLNVVAKLAEMSQNGTLKQIGSDAKYTEQELRELISKGGMDALTFAKAMDLAFGEHATAANETYTGSLRNMKAALSRIGADFVAPIHESERQIFLSARSLFDRIRKLTKPFAEGKFSTIVDDISKKTSKFLESLDLKWLEKIIGFLDRSNSWMKPIDWAINGLNSINEISKRLFSNWKGTEERNDPFHWVYGVRDALKKAQTLVTGLIFKNRVLQTYVSSIADRMKLIVQNLSWVVNKAFDKILPHTDKIHFVITHLLHLLLVASHNLRTLGDSAGRLAYSIFNLFTTILKKVFKNVNWFGEDNIFVKIGQAMLNLTDNYIVPGIDKLTAFVDKITELIEKGPSAESSLGKIGHGFEVVGGFISNVVSGISTFLSYILGLKEGETIFSKFGDWFKTIGETVRNAFGYIRTALQSFLGGEDGKQFIKNAAALYTVILGYRKLESKKWAFGRMGRAFEFIKELITGAYDKIKAINPLEWADTIETVLKRTSGALRAFSDNLNAKSLVAIGGAVVVLAVGLSVLAAVAEGGHLVSAIGALTVMMALLVGAFWAIKAITDQGLFKNITKGWKGFIDLFKNSISKYMNAITLKETATAMLTFAAAVGVLAIALGGLALVFDNLKNTGSAGGAFLAVAGLVVLLSGMLIWITNATKAIGMLDSTKFFAFAAAFIGIAVAVGLLSLAIAGLTWAFSKLDSNNFWAAIGAIGAVIVLCAVLTGAAVVLSKFAQDPMVLFAATAMVLIAAAIDILVLGLVGLTYALSDLGGGKLWNAIGMIAVLAVILGGVTVALSYFAPLALLAAPATVMIALAIDLLIVGLIGLGAAVKYIGGGKLWNAIGMIAVLSVIFVALMSVVGALSPILAAAGGVFEIFSDVAMRLSGAFVNIADGMVVLAGALNMMPADGSLEVIGKGLKVVAGGISKLGLATILMPRKSEEVYNGLIPLGTALTVLEDIDIAKLTDKKTGLSALSNALREAFGGHFFGLFGSLGGSLGAGSAGLAAAGPALALLGEGLQKLSPGLEAFNNAGDLNSITANLQALVYAVMDISDYGYDTTFKFMPQMATALESIAVSLNSLSADQISLLSSLGTTLGDAFTDNTGAAVEALSIELEQLTSTLEQGSQQFIVNARHIPTHIQSGIEDNTVLAVNAMKKMLWNIGSEANSEQLRNNWRIIGGNIAIGIANGISSRTAEAANAMRRLASALQTSFTVSLQIRSPSRIFEHLAEYIPMGIARGIQNGETGITDSMASSMTGAMDLLDQYSRNSDLSPTVTPVMDMANMKRDIRYADRMFAGSQVGNFNGFNGLTVHGDAISYNMQNRDVVNEIKNMTGQINRLGEAIQNMQMVLDSGVLVGQIGRQMNNELGTIAIRERRQ